MIKTILKGGLLGLGTFTGLMSIYTGVCVFLMVNLVHPTEHNMSIALYIFYCAIFGIHAIASIILIKRLKK